MPIACTAPSDPLLLDADQLYALATERVVHAGLDDFQSKRVTRVVREEELLWAEVEDAESGVILTTEVSRDTDGTLLVACPCERDEALCRHAVAALFDLVEMTLPDKPNSRLQRYRLTQKALRYLRG